MQTLAQIGRAIADARKRAGLSQEALAVKVEMSRNHVGAVERGERAPSLPAMAAIADVLGLSLDAVVLGRAEGSPRDPEVAAMVDSIQADLRPLLVDWLKSVAARRPGRKRR